jgi:hypothetical protein
VSWFGDIFRFASGAMATNSPRDLRMCPIEENGWQIHRDKGLSSHQSGFHAEYRNTSIYSIKQFPYEATIHDIRNWVMKAENLLSRIRQGSTL